MRPIGEAARTVGLSPSALRYYEQRGLVSPAARRAGRRWYDTAELRRLAFIQLIHQLGLPLTTAAAMLDEPDVRWREEAEAQIARLDALIARARGAQAFLRHTVTCPSEHPVTECPDLVATLDQLLAGRTVDDLADEHRAR
ncbi:MerR family transcriptional regulator [Tenggerimyces flavus]|uniref:MerR family transcriptional regulator n=1 Tax=Tenggerimyces flavus TaxID=1708749 RepID=A0ABV7Y3E4_9ACTN|nr:MerR family transcriptional regulator [Tenggerimyces flavus]MBM7790075.1 DNA-binding transcriptional MerR regulator [Tenggerimyces flavus]